MARPTLRLSVRSLFDRSADLHVVPPTAAPLRFSKDYKSSFPCTLSRAAVNVQCDCSPGAKLVATFKVVFQGTTQSAVITVTLDNGTPRISIHSSRGTQYERNVNEVPQNTQFFYSLESSAYDGPMNSISQHILRGTLPNHATSFLWVRLVLAPVPMESSLLSVSANPKHIYNVFDDSASPIIKRDVLSTDTQCLIWQNVNQKRKYQAYSPKAQDSPLPVAFRRPYHGEKSSPDLLTLEYIPGLDMFKKLELLRSNVSSKRVGVIQWYLKGTLQLQDGTTVPCFKTQHMNYDTDDACPYRNYSLTTQFSPELSAIALGGLKGTLTWQWVASSKSASAKFASVVVDSIPHMEFYWVGAMLPKYFSVESDHITATVPDIPIALLRAVLSKLYLKRADFLEAALEWAYRKANKAMTEGPLARYFSHEKSLFQLFNYLQDINDNQPKQVSSKDQAAIAKVLVDLAADSPDDWARLHILRQFGPLSRRLLGDGMIGPASVKQVSSQHLNQQPNISIAEHWVVEIPNLRGKNSGNTYTDTLLEKSVWVGFNTKQQYVDAFKTPNVATSASGMRSPRRFNFPDFGSVVWEQAEYLVAGFTKTVDSFQMIEDDYENKNHNFTNGVSEGIARNVTISPVECSAPWTNDVLCHFLEDNFPARQIQLDLQATGPKLWATWTINPESSSFEPATLVIMSSPDASTASTELRSMVSPNGDSNDGKHYHLTKTAEFPDGVYEADTEDGAIVALTVANLLIVVEGYPSLHRTRRVARSISSYASRHVISTSKVHRPLLAHISNDYERLAGLIPMNVIRIGDESVLNFQAQDFVTFSIGFYGKGEIMVIGEEQDHTAKLLRIRYTGSKIGVCGIVVWLFHRETFAAVSRSCVVEVVPSAAGRLRFVAS